MPNLAVTLDVRNFPASTGDGYTNTTASNNAIYSFRYTGGSDGEGNITVTKGSGNAAIRISLDSDSRYSITDINFTGDPVEQLTWRGGGQANVAVITDANTQLLDARYTTIVTDGTARCTVPCDPAIKNVPPTT